MQIGIVWYENSEIIKPLTVWASVVDERRNRIEDESVNWICHRTPTFWSQKSHCITAAVMLLSVIASAGENLSGAGGYVADRAGHTVAQKMSGSEGPP